MRFFKLIVSLAFLASCLFISEAFAADAAKIGFADFQKILRTSEAGKAADQKIQTKMKALQDELKAKGTAIEEEKARYEREMAVMSKEARSEKERDLQIKAFDFQGLKTKYEEEMKAYYQELVSEIQKVFLEVADQVGKNEGYLLILDKGSSGIVYAPSTIDITDKVLQQVNEAFAKKQNG